MAYQMEQDSTQQKPPFRNRYSEAFKALYYPSLLATLLLFVKTVFVIITPLRALAMTPWLIDDSFIFMRIARNLALGKGYSFDGLNPTSGAPLIWTLLTSLNHFLLGPEAAAKATIIESSLFGAASTVIVFYIAFKAFNRRIAWGAFLLCSLSAPMLFNSANGMETSLFTFIGLLAVCLYLDKDKLTGRKCHYWYFALGSLLGVANLIRADAIFLAFAIVLLEGLRLLKSEVAQRKERCVQILYLVVGVFLFTLPSLMWSLHVAGTLFPSNQIGRRFLAWEGAISANGSIIWPAYFQKIGGKIIHLYILLTIMIGSVFLLALSFVSTLLRERTNQLTRLLIMYVVTYFGTLAIYQGYFPDVHGLRYLNLAGHLLSIPLVVFCNQIASFGRRTRFIQRALLSAIMVGLVLSSFFHYEQLRRRIGWANEMHMFPIYSNSEIDEWWSFLDWASHNLPKGTVIAAKDHGRLAYFTSTHIVDLAGIIDPDVIKSVSRGDVESYLNEREAEYVLLPETGGRPVHKAIRASLNLEEIPGVPHQECSEYILYSIQP